jgi:hypothetical protein
MAIADDFSVAVNGDIRYTGTTTNYTVLELHRFLQDLADNASSSGDDLHDITDSTSSDRSTDNIITLNSPYNIDDTAAEHLYDGSITQAGGDTIYAGLEVLGTVETGTQLQIVQDNALLTNYWTTGINVDAANNIILRMIVKVRVDGADIDGRRIRIQAREFSDSYAEFGVTMGLGVNAAAISTSPDRNNETAAGTVATYDQFSNTEGYQLFDVTGDGSTEPYYSQWLVTGGGATPASPTINDLYEWTKYEQRRGTSSNLHSINGELFRGITHEWAYDAEAGGGPATNDQYAWGTFLDTGVVSGGPFQVGEKVTGGTSGAYGRVLAVDTTNTSLVVSTESGTWQNGETVTGTTSSASATTSAGPVGQATGGGVGLTLAVDDNGTTGTLWIQLLKGTAPADDAVCYEDTDHTSTLTVNGSVTTRTVSPEFIGVSTGAAIIGAFGIGIDPDDLTASDQLTDLLNTPNTPPNNVTFSVTGLDFTVTEEDQVLVGPEDGSGGLDLDQLSVNTDLTGAAETSITTTTAIPSDTPSSGTIRVELNTGTYRLQTYTSFTGSTFTIPSTDYSGSNQSTGNKNLFISYIDKAAAAATESFTVVYNDDRTLFIRVRNGGSSPIKTFETTGTLGNAGGETTAIRQSDS